jgi:hypothetical protein
LGKDHPDLATPLIALGRMYHFQYKFNDAENLCRKALEIQERALGKLYY